MCGPESCVCVCECHKDRLERERERRATRAYAANVTIDHDRDYRSYCDHTITVHLHIFIRLVKNAKKHTMG